MNEQQSEYEYMAEVLKCERWNELHGKGADVRATVGNETIYTKTACMAWVHKRKAVTVLEGVKGRVSLDCIVPAQDTSTMLQWAKMLKTYQPSIQKQAGIKFSNDLIEAIEAMPQDAKNSFVDAFFSHLKLYIKG